MHTIFDHINGNKQAEPTVILCVHDCEVLCNTHCARFCWGDTSGEFRFWLHHCRFDTTRSSTDWKIQQHLSKNSFIKLNLNLVTPLERPPGPWQGQPLYWNNPDENKHPWRGNVNLQGQPHFRGHSNKHQPLLRGHPYRVIHSCDAILTSTITAWYGPIPLRRCPWSNL